MPHDFGHLAKLKGIILRIGNMWPKDNDLLDTVKLTDVSGLKMN